MGLVSRPMLHGRQVTAEPGSVLAAPVDRGIRNGDRQPTAQEPP
jgi:hypothetical protein